MKKLNLKKPLALYEDFAASDLSKPNQSVTPAGKTETAAITVDKVVAKPTGAEATISSGDKVRAEIVQDVDAILTNLEALSKSITESINLEFDEFIKELTEGTLNEAEDGFMAKIMKSIASAKSYSTVMGTYPTMSKNLLKAEVTKNQKLKELALKAGEMEAEQMEKLSAKFKEAVKAAEGIAAKQKVRAKRDGLKAKAKAQGDVQLKKATDKLTLKLDNTIRDIKAKITKVEKDNPIESEDLKLKWAEQKLAIDDKHAMEKIEQNGNIDMQYADGGDKSEEFKKGIEEKIAKLEKKQRQETAEAKAAISDDLKDYKASLDKEGSNDEQKVKDAKAKIRTFIDAHSAYLAKLQGTDFELLNKKKPTDEEKEQIKAQKADTLESQKKYNELKDGLSATTFANAEGTDKEKGAETLKAITDATAEQIDEYKSQLDSMSTDQDLKGKKKFDEKKVQDAIDSAQTELDGLPEDTKAQDKAKVEIKLLTAKIAMAKGKKEDTAELETELKQAEATAKMKDPRVPSGGGNNLSDDQKSRIASEETQRKERQRKLDAELAKPEEERSQEKIDGLKAGIAKNNSDIADIKAEQSSSANINTDGFDNLTEASLNGMQAISDDDYKYLKAEAKKLGVKVSVDKDPFGDGTDEISFSGDKSAIMKLAKISGHAEMVGDDNVYQIAESKKELPKKVKLYEGMSIADKFKALM